MGSGCDQARRNGSGGLRAKVQTTPAFARTGEVFDHEIQVLVLDGLRIRGRRRQPLREFRFVAGDNPNQVPGGFRSQLRAGSGKQDS